ncbi:MAG: response regulator [Burkholderiaceae bacterium]|nr:MAG: response regulator [Burkholderiaceae bacterium]
MHVLLVEDDTLLGEAIQEALAHWSYVTTWVKTGGDAAIALREGVADFVLLDLGLPGRDGLEVLRKARRLGVRTPVLVMTARSAVSARITGLDAGADDYLVKPFDMDELGARMRSLIRRSSGRADNRIDAGDLVLDIGTHEAVFRKQCVSLTRREFALLRLLMERAGQIVRRESLELSMYGLEGGVQSNSLEVQIHTLRRKLAPDLIRTVRGVGYMIPRDPQ